MPRAFNKKFIEEEKNWKRTYDEKLRKEQKKKRILEAIFIPLGLVLAVYGIYYFSTTVAIEPKKVVVSKEPVIKYSYQVKPLINRQYFYAVHYGIKEAKKKVYVIMYVLTMGKKETHPVNILMQDLVDAHKRGVEVKVVLKEPNPKSDKKLYWAHVLAIDYLKKHGIDAKFPRKGIHIHDKLVLIDDYLAIMGNHNWTQGALRVNNEVSVAVKSDPPDPRFSNYFRDVYEGWIIGR